MDDHLKGMYHALLEARIPFEMVHDALLEAADVDRYRVLVLPNVAALSDAQCRKLADYVARGGSLVATFETSLYDEAGAPRARFRPGRRVRRLVRRPGGPARCRTPTSR